MSKLDKVILSFLRNDLGVDLEMEDARRLSAEVKPLMLELIGKEAATLGRVGFQMSRASMQGYNAAKAELREKVEAL